MQNTKVGVIHTFLYSVEDLKALFAEILPEVEMINIIAQTYISLPATLNIGNHMRG